MTLKRWGYYLELAWLDLIRLRGTVALHIVIVAGICLPVLLLLGLKRGHIEELRRDLVTSPTGRQIIVSVGGQGEIFTPENLPRLQAELGPVDVIVPDAERIGDLIRKDAQVPDDSVAGVTLRSTVPGDPILAQYDADVLRPGDQAIVLFSSVAKELGVDAGDVVGLTVSRRVGGSRESASVDLEVKQIVPSDSDGKIAYLEIGVVNSIERYVRGGRVAEFGWPAIKESVTDRYAEYFLFCEVADPLSDDDLEAIDSRGYHVEEVLDEEVCTLYGILRKESLEQLVVYRLFSKNSRSNPTARLSLSLKEVASITAADDVVVPWNSPCRMTIDKQPHLLVGFSLPRRTWLKAYMRHPESTFPYSADGASIMLGAGSEFAAKPSLRLSVDDKCMLEIIPFKIPPSTNLESFDHGAENVASTPDDSHSSPSPAASKASWPSLDNQRLPIGIVPVQFLARLDAYDHGLAEFDEATKLFIPVPPEATYTQLRLYATTIDDVLNIIPELELRRYAYRAQNARIQEIKGQDQQLVDLVLIVGLGVFFFGVLTVVSVLLDATERKRGTIGILRVMGVSRIGVFGIVFTRAIAVGVAAGFLTWGIGEVISQILSWEPAETSALSQRIASLFPEVKAIIGVGDIATVLIGSASCCVIGAIYPAWKASRLDPFDAVVEGKFR